MGGSLSAPGSGESGACGPWPHARVRKAVLAASAASHRAGVDAHPGTNPHTQDRRCGARIHSLEVALLWHVQALPLSDVTTGRLACRPILGSSSYCFSSGMLCTKSRQCCAAVLALPLDPPPISARCWRLRPPGRCARPWSWFSPARHPARRPTRAAQTNERTKHGPRRCGVLLRPAPFPRFCAPPRTGSGAPFHTARSLECGCLAVDVPRRCSLLTVSAATGSAASGGRGWWPGAGQRRCPRPRSRRGA